MKALLFFACLLAFQAPTAQAAIIDFTPSEITSIQRKLVKKADCKRYGSDFDDQVQVTVGGKTYHYGICHQGPGSAYVGLFERAIKNFAGGPPSESCLKWERCYGQGRCERQYGTKRYSRYSMRLFTDGRGVIDTGTSHRISEQWVCE